MNLRPDAAMKEFLMPERAFQERMAQKGISSPTDSIAEKRAGPGLLLMSASMQLIYCDPCARQLWLLLNKEVSGTMAYGVLPPDITNFCHEVIQLLSIRRYAKDWEEFQLKRVIGTLTRRILLRGIGMPSGQGPSASILVIMEEVGRRHIDQIDEAKDRFALTDREMTVIRHLVKGETNKQIGIGLGIVEQTVKEHIKNIMHKTKTTTRTGILMRVLGYPGSPEPRLASKEAKTHAIARTSTPAMPVLSMMGSKAPVRATT
jgi:DNA-binding CsgD family transcriptional regulator